MKIRSSGFIICLVALLLALSLHAQPCLDQVKRVVDGDTVLLASGDRVRLIGVDTPEVHKSKKLYRDAERTGKDVKTIIAMGKKAMVGSWLTSIRRRFVYLDISENL